MTATTTQEMLASLDEADRCHDDDPQRAAALLRRLDPASLPPERWPGLAFLLNHVFGEKLGRWIEAHAMFYPLLRAAGEEAPLALWRQAAAAAHLAGDAADAKRLTDTLAASAGVSAGAARDVVALTVAMLRTPTLAAVAAADCVAPALQALAWQQAGPLDAAVAACANNIASGLVERPHEDLQHPALRAALDAAAELAERFWLRAGNWVHHERAAYLRAMVGNALADARQARAHALRALALLDANDAAKAEQVDRAFIELEHAHACRALDLPEEARAADEVAAAIAAAFEDAFLADWFASRRKKLAALAEQA